MVVNDYFNNNNTSNFLDLRFRRRRRHLYSSASKSSDHRHRLGILLRAPKLTNATMVTGQIARCRRRSDRVRFPRSFRTTAPAWTTLPSVIYASHLHYAASVAGTLAAAEDGDRSPTSDFKVANQGRVAGLASLKYVSRGASPPAAPRGRHECQPSMERSLKGGSRHPKEPPSFYSIFFLPVFSFAFIRLSSLPPATLNTKNKTITMATFKFSAVGHFPFCPLSVSSSSSQALLTTYPLAFLSSVFFFLISFA